MNLKYTGIFGVFLIGVIATLVATQVNVKSIDPASSMAGFFMEQVHANQAAIVHEEPVLKIADFRLSDTTGKEVTLGQFRDKKAIAVVFIGAECPLANLYVLRLAEMQREFGPQGLQVIAINSNSQDSAEDIAQHAERRKLPFPVLVDPEQKVADLFGAERTPEAFLLSSNGEVRYQGRIDDQYAVGSDRRTTKRHDLKEAIKAVLAGNPVRVAKTVAPGCFIGRFTEVQVETPVTYTRDVAPIMQKYCQECHRPGQAAPFSLLTYAQAKSWAKTIGEQVESNRMPPWHADPKHGEFANDTRLPAAERKLLLTWIKQGRVKGDDADLPSPRQFAQGWQIEKPDLVLTMKEKFTIPAIAPDKGIAYQHFVLPTNFEEDVWVTAVECRPGVRAVVHHMIVYIGDKPANTDGQSGDVDMLAAYVPGSKAAIYPKGLAKRIPKGAKLVLEMHYTANGTEHVDQSSIALVFTKEAPEHELRSRFILNRDFVIPANAANHRVVTSSVFANDSLLLAMSPHMHVRGKSFEFRAIYPDGKSEILLSVPRYDFNWQHSYALKSAKHMPAGTKLECIAHFDNSPKNPNNPDATQEVRWGDQSWEEMMLGVVTYIDLKK